MGTQWGASVPRARRKQPRSLRDSGGPLRAGWGPRVPANGTGHRDPPQRPGWETWWEGGGARPSGCTRGTHLRQAAGGCSGSPSTQRSDAKKVKGHASSIMATTSSSRRGNSVSDMSTTCKDRGGSLRRPSARSQASRSAWGAGPGPRGNAAPAPAQGVALAHPGWGGSGRVSCEGLRPWCRAPSPFSLKALG